MPYIGGVRVSNQEWSERYGSHTKQLHTGPNGENPASEVELDPETRAPKSERKAGSKRSSKSAAKVAAAVATATGQELPDLASLDAEVEE